MGKHFECENCSYECRVLSEMVTHYGECQGELDHGSELEIDIDGASNVVDVGWKTYGTHLIKGNRSLR